jgi:hypothetical protein
MVLVKGGHLLLQVGLLEHHLLAAAGLLGLSSLLAIPTRAGLLEDTYSVHMLPFFQPKKSTICLVEAPPSAALVALVRLKLWKVYFSGSWRARRLAMSLGTLEIMFLPMVSLTSRPDFLLVYQALPWKISSWSLSQLM